MTPTPSVTIVTVEDPLPPVVIFDAYEKVPHVVIGSFAFASGLANKRQKPLGINMRPQLRGHFLRYISGRDDVSEADGHLLESPEISISMVSDEAIATFDGVILFTDADEARRGLLTGISVSTVLIVPKTEEEAGAVAELFPAAGRARLRLPEPNWTDNFKALKKFFDERYDLVAQGSLGPDSPQMKLGKGEPQICRYCGRQKPLVTFADVSHALPELVGTNKVIDGRECDQCNKNVFQKVLDDHFGKWSLPLRTMSRIRRKKSKLPTYKSADDSIRIEGKPGQLTIWRSKTGNQYEILEEKNQIIFRLERMPYSPMAVFKSFVKMALAVMPEQEAQHCQHLKDWILQPKHTFESFRFGPLKLFTHTIPGPIPNYVVSYALLRRKPDVKTSPYLIFVLRFANFQHQIALPMPQQDHGEGRKDLEFMAVPHPWDTVEHAAKYGVAEVKIENLSQPGLKRGDKVELRFQFESVTEGVEFTEEPSTD